MTKEQVEHIKKVLKDHIQNSSPQQIYKELVEAGMERWKDFEEKYNIEIDERTK